MRFNLIILFVGFYSLISCNLKSAKDYFFEAEILEENEKYKEAIILLDKAIAKDEKFLGAYINRGVDKSILGDYKGAIEDYKKVLALNPRNTMALFNIGNNYKRLKNFDTALSYYNKAFESKGEDKIYIDWVPNNFTDLNKFDVKGYEISYERAYTYYEMDSLNRSYEDFQHTIRNGYLVGDCYLMVGYIHIVWKQKEKACEYFAVAKKAGNILADIDIAKYCK